MLIRIPWDTPSFLCASTDLISGSVIGSGSAITEGGLLYLYDTQEWKRIMPDMSVVSAGGTSGSFLAASGETVTIVNGIITSIV